MKESYSIKEYCEHHGISQAELARRLKCSPTKITIMIDKGWRIINGQVFSGRKYQYAITDDLNTKPND